MKGKIKKVVREKGFGFIKAEDKRDVFFHRSALAGGNFDTLEEGTDVEFNVEQDPKGPRAVRIKMLNA